MCMQLFHIHVTPWYRFFYWFRRSWRGNCDNIDPQSCSGNKDGKSLIARAETDAPLADVQGKFQSNSGNKGGKKFLLPEQKSIDGNVHARPIGDMFSEHIVIVFCFWIVSALVARAALLIDIIAVSPPRSPKSVKKLYQGVMCIWNNYYVDMCSLNISPTGRACISPSIYFCSGNKNLFRPYCQSCSGNNNFFALIARAALAIVRAFYLCILYQTISWWREEGYANLGSCEEKGRIERHDSRHGDKDIEGLRTVL